MNSVKQLGAIEETMGIRVKVNGLFNPVNNADYKANKHYLNEKDSVYYVGSNGSFDVNIQRKANYLEMNEIFDISF